MAKKAQAEMTKEELVAELDKEKLRSDKLQKEKEERDEEHRQAEARAKADAAAARDSAPTEAQWVKLEEEYNMTRDEIQKQWRLIQKANAPLQAELQGYKNREAAQEAVRVAKEALKDEDAQFPKYERFVDEYLTDVPLQDKADPDRLKKHMDRALHFARGKARATDKSFREDPDPIKEGGGTEEEKADAALGFGEFDVSGMALTINNQKLVPDDFRKRHAHPEQKNAVRMNERARWNDGVPKKPR